MAGYYGKYKIKGLSNELENLQTHSPKSWTFLGSKDGSTWDLLDTRKNITTWELGVWKTFIFTSVTKPSDYKAYRILVTESQDSDEGYRIEEMKIYDENDDEFTVTMTSNADPQPYVASSGS